MKKIDENEKKILKELVRNPRQSDNQLAKRTGIPLKTVNRKRKLMEKHGILNYITWVDNGPSGTGEFSLPQMFIVKLQHGITRKKLTESLLGSNFTETDIKHTVISYVGEIDGHVCLIIVYASRQDTDILEIFNAELVPKLKGLLGQDCIHSVQSIQLTTPISLMHNYLPLVNMENGTIRQSWPGHLIYVG